MKFKAKIVITPDRVMHVTVTPTGKYYQTNISKIKNGNVHFVHTVEAKSIGEAYVSACALGEADSASDPDVYRMRQLYK